MRCFRAYASALARLRAATATTSTSRLSRAGLIRAFGAIFAAPKVPIRNVTGNILPLCQSSAPSRTFHPVVIQWRTSPALPACTVAAAMAVVALGAGWRGGDWPAQVYRVDLFRRAGFTQGKNSWSAAPPTPASPLLYPPLAAVVGITIIAVLSAVVATWCFALMARRWL